MSINPDHQPRVDVPNTMDYTDTEREAARNAANHLSHLKGEKAKENKGHFGLFTKVGVGLAAVAVGAVVGANKLGIIGGNNTEPKQEAGSSAPSKVGEKAANNEAATSEFGISAAEFGNNPEELVKEYLKQRNEFFIAGITRKSANSDERATTTTENFVDEISAPIDADFIKKMFVSDWESNPDLESYVNSMLDIATQTRIIRASTSLGTQKPYYRKENFDSVTPTADPLTVSYRYFDSDNREENNGGDYFADDATNINDIKGGSTITWVNVDGQLKIADVQYFSGE